MDIQGYQLRPSKSGMILSSLQGWIYDVLKLVTLDSLMSTVHVTIHVKLKDQTAGIKTDN